MADDDRETIDPSAPDVLDLRGTERDAAADGRDRAATARDDAALDRPGDVQTEHDRSLAARDRLAAALDRQEAALDRQRAAEYLERAYYDELTGTLHRTAGRDHLQREVDRARRTTGSLIVAFLDVDHLKRVNDDYGHAEGDALLRALGRALIDGLRSTDVVVRYGGDEFVCALPGATVAEATERFAAVRDQLATSRPHDTFSVGLAELAPDESFDAVVRRADMALYGARAAS